MHAGCAEEGQLSCVSSESSEDAHDGFFSVGTPSATEVIFVREGVAVRPSRSVCIPGRLSLVSPLLSHASYNASRVRTHHLLKWNGS